MTPEQRLAMFCQALGDANRLRILSFLGGERRSVSEIVAAVGISQPLASHHLRAMREQGVVETQREGPFVYYTLCDPRLLQALSFLAEVAKEANTSQGDASGVDPPWPFCCSRPTHNRRTR